MNCNKYRDEIEELESGQSLSPSSTAHVNSCSKCAVFRDERAALRQMIHSLEVVDAPADFDFRMRARLARVKGRETGRALWSRFSPGRRSLALAASFVIIVAFGFVVRQFIRGRGVANKPQSIVNVTPRNGDGPNTNKSNPPEQANTNAGVTRNPAEARASDLVVRHRAGSTNAGNVRKNSTGSNETVGDQGSSVDSSVSSASSVMPPGISDPTLMRSAVAVPIRMPTQATSITLKDRSSELRTFTLRPVTFGEQDIFEESTARWRIVPAVRGIW